MQDKRDQTRISRINTKKKMDCSREDAKNAKGKTVQVFQTAQAIQAV